MEESKISPRRILLCWLLITSLCRALPSHATGYAAAKAQAFRNLSRHHQRQLLVRQYLGDEAVLPILHSQVRADQRALTQRFDTSCRRTFPDWYA